MQQVFASVAQHDMRLATLAALISVLSSYAAYSLVGRGVEAGSRARGWWIAAGAFATGCGVWVTHFIAQLGYTPPVPVAYDVSLVALSLVVAILVSGLGFAITMMRAIGMPMLGGAVVGIVVYSIVFGLGHIEQGYAAAIATGSLGATWGLVYWRRQSIIAPIVSHAGFNLLQLVKYVSLVR